VVWIQRKSGCHLKVNTCVAQIGSCEEGVRLRFVGKVALRLPNNHLQRPIGICACACSLIRSIASSATSLSFQGRATDVQSQTEQLAVAPSQRRVERLVPLDCSRSVAILW
jgi:hypothetical protein